MSQAESASGIKKAWLHSKKPIFWLVAAVVGTLISVYLGRAITDSTDEAQRTALHSNPLAVTVLPESEMPPNGFAILVDTPADFPADFVGVNDCKSLWSKGLEMQGAILEPATRRLVLTNSTKDIIAITDMRAEVVKSEPAKNGTLLRCPPDLGGTLPIGTEFNLMEGGQSAATIQGSDGTAVPQFRDGFAITFESGEVVPIAVTAHLPRESTTWAIEADVLIDGQTHAMDIDGRGDGFVSAGRLNEYQYDAGVRISQGGRGEGSTWGVDHNYKPGRLENGQLQLGNLLLPDGPQIDVYQTTGRLHENEQRWIRVDGHPLIRFNPTGVAAWLEEPAERCGRGATREVLQSFLLMHGDQEFEHTVYEYQCGSGTSASSFLVQTAEATGSDTLFVMDQGSLGKDKVDLATEILNNVRHS